MPVMLTGTDSCPPTATGLPRSPKPPLQASAPGVYVLGEMLRLELDGAPFEVYVTRTGKLAVWCNHPPEGTGVQAFDDVDALAHDWDGKVPGLADKCAKPSSSTR